MKRNKLNLKSKKSSSISLEQLVKLTRLPALCKGLKFNPTTGYKDEKLPLKVLKRYYLVLSRISNVRLQTLQQNAAPLKLAEILKWMILSKNLKVSIGTLGTILILPPK